MKPHIYRFLSQNWSGLAIALLLAAIAVGMYLTADQYIEQNILLTITKVCAGALFIVAALLTTGAMFHLVKTARMTAENPPMGKRIDVGGYCVHMVAEGSGGPTVVWIPGSHDQGLAFHHIHKDIKNETRSVLYDRAACGYSDTGPYPRDLTREVAELKAALDGAGEKGPFIIVAHSLGGLLAQNFADRHPDDVAGLVLLDSACPDAAIYTSMLGKENKITGAGLGRWFATVFGLAWIVIGRMKGEARNWLSFYDADVQQQIILGNCQARLTIGFISALESIVVNPFDMVKGKGALGDIPILAIIPPVPEEKQAAEIRTLLPNFSEPQIKNFIRLRIDAQHQTARLSSQGELQYSPAGTTHGFPFEAPDFTREQIYVFIKRVRETST